MVQEHPSHWWWTSRELSFGADSDSPCLGTIQHCLCLLKLVASISCTGNPNPFVSGVDLTPWRTFPMSQTGAARILCHEQPGTEVECFPQGGRLEEFTGQQTKAKYTSSVKRLCIYWTKKKLSHETRPLSLLLPSLKAHVKTNRRVNAGLRTPSFSSSTGWTAANGKHQRVVFVNN